ncbi:MAG: hypothetical protein IKC24_05565 [Oscillospiraceae bacterium]|nr:hypothetical protein [Oscillospiraceae bacterium]
MKRKLMKWTAVLALVLVVAGVSAYATAGGQNDPLVSLSYLNETFLTTVTEKVQELIGSRDAELKTAFSEEIAAAEREIAAEYGSGSEGSNLPGEYETTTFVVVTLEKGQTLVGKIGCELMLRVGSASCVADSSPGLVDTTAGSTLGGGKALAANHLYMATVDGRGLTATANTVKVLVRGPYTIY